MTGGTGCVGRATVARLLAAGHAVRGVWRGRSPESLGFAAAGALEWVRAELAVDDVAPLVKGCDAVVHLAALVHRAEVHDPAAYRRENLATTERLHGAAIAAGIQPGRFAFASTVAVYGRDFDLHADESTPTQPRSPYGESKLAAERVVLERGGVALRLPITHGPGDRGNFATLVRAIERGRFALPGPCEEPRSLLSAANAAHGFALAIEQAAAAQLFLLTDDDDRSVRFLARQIAAALAESGRPTTPLRELPYALVWPAAALGSALGRVGLRSPVTLAALRKLTTPLTFSCKKAVRTLGYVPVETFEVAVRKTVASLVSA
ncbi:MAG: NAD-dependent epimerase/dehydratase family protein [Candidatus Eisenbacteria bacterium]|uniref:NAD-dependent epimerase/dehydratase family protein n=1 Tax=Eiseniibacteriota bacterium TaxID=2212470 RepID=A0A849SK27_UNCEI|nr:NAD-dependent epimerase/dehydratase family protein [Candidatus Eisenbacteria bacterium]